MTENARKGLRLTRFEVIGLFGEFDHVIPLQVEERVTALIGPNGLGKTACLKLISALFRRNWPAFSTTEFGRITYGFSNGYSVTVTRKGSDDPSTEVSDALGVLFSVIDDAGTEIEHWSPRTTSEYHPKFSRVESYLPFVTRTAPRTWTHDTTRQTYTFDEIVENFRDLLPPSISNASRSRPTPALAEIISQIDCHLIETQRLVVFSNDEPQRAGASSTLAIARKAQLLKSIMATDLAVYGSTSQSLDRSFPKRVLSQGPITPRTDLEDRLEQLDTLRKNLTEAGILEPEADDALPALSEVDTAIAAVLNVYVDDTRNKLDVLVPLQKKILLFKELIDDRFAPKYINVNKEVGFIVRRSPSVDVPLEKLSSGEQHQLVLFFELLFQLKTNSLILIDEPELSLHVGWQKKFIEDLMEIIELNSFDVVLATHSPQLIGAWEHLVVELGDVDPQ